MYWSIFGNIGKYFGKNKYWVYIWTLTLQTIRSWQIVNFSADSFSHIIKLLRYSPYSVIGTLLSIQTHKNI